MLGILQLSMIQELEEITDKSFKSK
jgi:hypothetical protein